MYLKSVELQGFKSFADKIYLDFNPGITAIVGPNGSGKSNISDAIRWVMGEQSVKTLRGSRMEDVIFAGTEVRKPQGFAEVSLTLDNSQRIFDVDFEEVTVTRRVYRSGEGEYFINKAPCRLKDIHELFMDTGLGREGYSIVGQGKIDEILSNKSEDRRQIFEEAAGITKYKYRKNDAEKKLERTNENLVRVRDIMSTLEEQLEPLRIQSEKARKYLALRDTLRGIEVNMSVASIGRLRGELKRTEENLDAVSESISAVQKEADEIESRTETLRDTVRGFDTRTEECREEKLNATRDTGEENNRISLMRANIGHCRENIERINSELEKSARGTAQLESLIAEYAKGLDELNENGKRIEDEAKTLDAEYERANGSFEAENEEIENIKSDIIEKTSEINSLNGKIVNSNILTENFKKGYDSAKNELESKSADFERLSGNTERLGAAVRDLGGELEKMRAELSGAETDYRQKGDLLRELRERYNNALSELSRKNSRLGALEDMENDFEGYSRSVKGVMSAYKEGRLRGAEIYGPLSALITTDKKYALAIDTALASVGQNIVTRNEQDAKRAIEYLKQNRLGRATFMPVSTVKSRGADMSAAKGMKGYIAVAKELVDFDPMYDGVVGNVLGATVVADNIDNAIAMAARCGHRFRIVTLEGDVMQAGGAMSGGSSGKNSGFLSRSAEIDALKAETASLKARLKDTENKIAENKSGLAAAAEKIEKQRTAVAAKNTEYIQTKADFEHSERYLSDFSEARDRLISDMESAKARIAEINADIEKSREGIKKAEGEICALENAVAEKENRSEETRRAVSEIRERLMQKSMERTANQKDIEMQEERLSGVRRECEEINRESAARRAEIAALEQEIESLNAQIKAGENARAELDTRVAELDRELADLAEKKAAAEKESETLRISEKDVRERQLSLNQQKVKIEAQKAKTEQDLDGIFTRLWEEYELTYSQAAELCTDENVDIAKAAKEVAELKGKIKALGNINIDAIEEYKDVKERFDFLTEQTNDLESAKAELEKIIEEMLAIMKKQFSEQFAVISRNFNSVFRELFGGGQANLSLADPTDILESGIEIEAQPPGKKLQSLTLLSGGERAFTAIALLFAILKVRPTPFCILDEIEAALDDVNVYRYADYLKKYSNKTQFIVVTHRRGTMEAANILYGVTMQERGISKLLSLNIDEVTE